MAQNGVPLQILSVSNKQFQLNYKFKKYIQRQYQQNSMLLSQMKFKKTLAFDEHDKIKRVYH
jgi:hypothetical protein